MSIFCCKHRIISLVAVVAALAAFLCSGSVRAAEQVLPMTVSIEVKDVVAAGGVYALADSPINVPRGAELKATYTLPAGLTDDFNPDNHYQRGYTWTVSDTHATVAGEAIAGVSSNFPTKGAHTYTVSVHVTWWPGTGEITYAGDATVTLSHYATQKEWTAGSAIGAVLNADGTPSIGPDGNPLEDGRMTAPQDQRAKPPKPDGQPDLPKPVRVAPGAKLGCSVETASDKDHWKIDGSTPAGSSKGDVADGMGTYKWTCSGGKFYTGDNPDGTPILKDTVDGAGAMWWAPTTPGSYSVTCTIDDLPAAVAAPDVPEDTPSAKIRDDSPLVRTTTISVWQASIRVKRKGQSIDKYGDDATVAAGSIQNSAHQADVEVTISDTNGNLLENQAIPDLFVQSGGQGPYPDTVTATVSGFGSTNAFGRSIGTFVSGNRTETSVIKLPYDQSDKKGSAGPTASILQVWNDLPGGNGIGKQWQYDKYFDFDAPIDVNSNVAFNGDVNPSTGVQAMIDVSGHHMEYVTSKMSGLVWDPTAGTDEDGDGLNDGDYVQKEYEKNKPGFDAPVSLTSSTKRSDLVAWNPKTATSSTRQYKTSLTIKFNEYFIIDSITFDAYDNDVFGPQGDTGE